MTDGTNTLSFKYDSSGIRTSKTVNGVETEFVYIGTTLVSQKTGNEVINFAYSAGGAPYGFTYNGTSYFYLANIQGDIIGIYDSNGNVVVEYTYDTWGKLISITGSLADTIGVKNPLRYRGYYYDNETGLYYLQSRYYDPETCRFINADSLLVAGDYLQGTNMFAYCFNNPVMYVDPSGMSSDSILGEGLVTIFAAMALIVYVTENYSFDIAENIFNLLASMNLSTDGFISMVDLIISEGYDKFLLNEKSTPPDHPNFTPPKKGNRWVKNPNGNGYGWQANDGGVWVWTPNMHGGKGWTVQYPNGKHTHAYPGGGTRTHFSNDGSLGVKIGFGLVATVILLADNVTVLGASDDPLIPLVWSAILA